MRMGYNRALSSRKAKKEKAYLKLDEQFNELYAHSDNDLAKRPMYQELLRTLRRGDTIVVSSLECFSRRYSVLADVLWELANLEVKIEVKDLPRADLTLLLATFTWVEANEKFLEPKVKNLKVGKEGQSTQENYRLLGKNREYRKVSWAIMFDFLKGESLRSISRQRNISKATIFRIKKQYVKVKQAISLIIVFLITIVSLKLAQSYSDNGFIQVIIGAITTLLIIYSVYKETDK